MDRTRILASTVVLAVALAAAAALAQPAPNANPNAFKKRPLTAECQKLRDDYLKAQDATKGGRGEGRDDGERAKGGQPELKAMRKEFETRCGALPPEMTPKTGDDAPAKAPIAATPAPATTTTPAPTVDACKAKPKDFADSLRLQQECEKQRRAAKAAATAGASAGATATAPTELPKKAGPATGTGYSGARCAQLHQSMKDALARMDACGAQQACRKEAQGGYEKVRTAYQSGCGEVPDDAKPRKR